MATNSSPLIGAAELRRALAQTAPPLVLDVRWSPTPPLPADRYAAGHLPGAVFVDLDRDLSAPPGRRGRHPLPGPAALQETLRRLGVLADGDVVVYDDAGGTTSARAWWLLRWAGHGRVRLLDGGLAAWTAAGGALSTDPVVPPPGAVEVRPGGMPVADLAAVESGLAGTLLDARASERFRGEAEPIDPVAGHIPGALNAPTLDNLGSDETFRPPADLRERFAAIGITDRSPVTAYCGSGVTAAHAVLALELAGIRATLYPGSWSEWIADPRRPVATS